tara:strand:+ start:1393 stop:6576 length:5184 start_codon:yes stop_codon:yes gene_type:complete
MPKKLYEIKDFSGGLNAYADPRDIKDNEFSQDLNISVDKTGVLRIVGSAEKDINAEYVNNPLFSSGYGLYQFAVDYGYNKVDGHFDYGFEQGTVVSATDASNIRIENTSTASITADYYNGMTIFIYEGTAAGDSRVISDYTVSGDEATKIVIVSTAFSSQPDNTSKYMIFRWQSVNFTTDSTGSETDYITNGDGIGYTTLLFPSGESSYSSESDFYAVQKIGNASDNTSVEGGYLQYNGASSSNITLAAGVTYNLSFDCGFKNKWRNIVTQGDSTNNYVGIPPWIELYSDTVTNGGLLADGELNAGLSLMYNNNWAKKDMLSGTDQNYIANPTKNYLENGDFRDTSNHWTIVEPVYVALDTSVTASSKYGGHAGTAKITTGAVSTAGSGTTAEPLGYVKSDAMELDNGAWYRINLVYKGEFGLRYAIRDTSANTYLIGWTSNGTTKAENEWKYPFQTTSSDDLKTDYIYFYVPSYTTGSTIVRNVELRLNSGKDNTEVYVSGISIKKAYNDLVNMKGSSPFLGTTESWSRYETKFRIPSEYDDATDWILRVHAGSWDYQDDAFNDEMSQSQEIYIDNIKISSDEGDTFTLLSSNNQLNSKLLLNSKSQGNTWNKLISYDQANSQLNFNYANGVLRVSDGNFKTDNPNKMFFYQKESNESLKWSNGWKIETNYLQLAPSIEAYSVLPEDELAASNPESFDLGAFDGISFCNHLFKDKYYKTPGEWETDGTSYMPSIQTDWALDQLGANPKWGIVTRYWWPGSHADTVNATPYECNIHAGATGFVETKDTQNKTFADKQHIVAAGWGRTDWDDDGGTRGGYFVNTDAFESQALWPLKLIIKSDSVSNPIDGDSEHEADGMMSHAKELNYEFEDVNHPNYVEDITVYKLEYSIDYELQFFHRGNSNGDANDLNFKHRPVPWFEVTAGVIKGGNDQTTEDFINSKTDLSIDYPRQMSVGVTGASNNINFEDVSTGGKSGDYLPGNPTVTETQGFDHTLGYARAKINFTGEFTWDAITEPISIKNGDDIIFTVKDMLDGTLKRCASCNMKNWLDTDRRSNAFKGHASEDDNLEGEHTFIAKPGGPQGDGTASANLPYSEEQIASSIEPDGVAAGDKFAPCNYTNLQYPYDTNAYAMYTKFYVKKFDVTFHDPQFVENIQQAEEEENFNLITISCSDNEVQVMLDFEVPDDIAPSGWAERTFKIATSVVNQFGEESALNIQSEHLPSGGTFPPTVCPNVSVYLGKTILNNENISKTKIYMKDSESDVWYLQFFIDHSKGQNGLLYSTVSGESATGANYTAESSDAIIYTLNHKYVKDFNEVNSYESETLVSQQDAEIKGNDNLTARYKCSIVANNRMYVGNIKQNGKIYGDRMIKSPPNKYGILPASNFIDVAINDGDEITALSFFKDRLLQFKRHKVFVINTSGDYEFLEDTFHNVGVQGQYSVASTPHGIVWANENGCYLYDGKKMKNLIENRIPLNNSYENPSTLNNRWCANSEDGDCVIGYDTNNDTLLVNFTKKNKGGTNPSGAVYHFGTKSWSIIFGIWSDSITTTNTGNMSNMITSTDGDILFYHTSETSSHRNQGIKTIRKWNHAPNNVLSAKNATFTTKDITFGDINVRKKIYKVYITYKVRENDVDSGLTVIAAKNGSNDFNVNFSQSSKFAFGQSNSSGTSCYTGAVLLETDGIWKTAELVPDNPSDLNNIATMQIKIYGTSVRFDTEINDISISYRTKNVK